MNILCVVPPYIPSYFNAGHHLPVFQVAEYLRKKNGSHVVARDFGALNGTWRDVCELLVQRYDLIAMLNDFDAIEGFDRCIAYVREITPQSRLLTFGRGSRQAPEFFQKRYPFDAVVGSGDYEAGVSGYVDYLETDKNPLGVWVRENSAIQGLSGRYLDAEDWILPDVREIPYEHYDRLYANDLAKFCGIPARRELVVPLARGCPVGCAFCEVPRQQGLKERRLSVESTIDYIEQSLSLMPFEYVSFYAPTFTLKKNWVLSFCSTVRERLPSLKWKCVTTLAHLDDHLIREMGTAGCVRISVGVETLYDDAAAHLPKLKQNANSRLDSVGAACARANIELNCFIMLGMPDEPLDSATNTINTLIARGFRIRPTVFTPYDQMNEEMSKDSYSAFNRQLLVEGAWSSEDRRKAYDLLYANSQDRTTAVAERIPEKRPIK